MEQHLGGEDRTGSLELDPAAELVLRWPSSLDEQSRAVIARLSALLPDPSIAPETIVSALVAAGVQNARAFNRELASLQSRKE